jgi:hypothetical protein
MLCQLHYKNFEPDEAVRSVANLALSRILDQAPYGSAAIALLEKQEDGFRFTLDVYSRRGPFCATFLRSTAGEAIRAVEQKVLGQIDDRRLLGGEAARNFRTVEEKNSRSRI